MATSEVRAKVAAFLLAPLTGIESVFPTRFSEQMNPMDPAMIRRKRMLGILTRSTPSATFSWLRRQCPEL